MSNNWSDINSSTDATGILRKPISVLSPQQQQQEQRSSSIQDLLVFGYACKIFRDDEKATFIDQGKHLISWMGDDNLKFDRYDVRATLFDLKQYEPPQGGYLNRLDYLTPAEQRAEQLCEEERYYSLYHNEEEEKMYKEEELKRLHQQASSTYGQVQFDYNKTERSLSATTTTKELGGNDENKLDEQDDTKYSIPSNLLIPDGIEMPETMKLHAIIEKTAKFISAQGPQMEILIKAKQSNNPQFEFLNANNPLNPYYKFILNEFKNGTYPVTNENETKNQENVENITDSNNVNLSNSLPYSSIIVPKIKYKPSADCAYTQLISKIKGVPLPPEQPVVEESVSEVNATVTSPLLTSHNSNQVNATTAITTATSTLAVGQKNVCNQDISKTKEGVEIKKISTGLALAQCYASDSEEENENSEVDCTKQEKQKQEEKQHLQEQQIVEYTEPTLNIPMPPDYLQHIIDKTAAYVVKNGKQFEDILRTKQDSRFLFLDPSNEYHQYYLYKVNGVINSSTCYPTMETNDFDKSKPINPVSFSIKTKEDAPVSIKPALPQEMSDDEAEPKDDSSVASNTDQNQNQNLSINPVTKVVVPEHVQRAIQLVESQLMNRGAQYAAAAAAAAAASSSSSISHVPNIPINPNINIKDLTQKSKFDVDNTGSLIINRFPLIPTTLPSTVSIKVDNTQQKELKRAEEKVKDKLAQIAREKLGLISKEKQLQLERKKKAMVFLNQIKSSATISSTSSKNSNDECGENVEDNNDSDDDSVTSSVHSIPITSPKNHKINENADDNNDRDDDDVDENDELNRIYDGFEKNRNQHQIVNKEKHTKSHERKRRYSRSRSRSKSKSSSHKHKKKSSSTSISLSSSNKHYNKKKSKRKSRSRSRSSSRNKTITNKKKSSTSISSSSRTDTNNRSYNSGSGSHSNKNYEHRRYRRSPTPTTTDRDRKHKKHSSPSSESSKKLKKKK